MSLNLGDLFLYLTSLQVVLDWSHQVCWPFDRLTAQINSGLIVEVRPVLSTVLL